MFPIILYKWDGEAMTPLPRFAPLARQRFSSYQLYRMEVQEERSIRTHNHFFACLHDAWLNLPESYTGRFADPNHLRKWCLITAGFRDERSIVASNEAEAEKIAAFVKPTAVENYAIVTVVGCVVTIYTAKSQSLKAMGKKDFQASKEAVFEVLARMIGVEVTDLKSNSETNDANMGRNSSRRGSEHER